AKSGFALLGCNVDVAVVKNPASRIGADVGSGPGQEDRADGAMIFPVYLEWIFPCVRLQNVVREILDARTCRAEAQRNVECLGTTRFNVAASDYERVGGFGRGIRRIRNIDRTLQINTEKVERTGSVIQPVNRHNQRWIRGRGE